MRPECSEAADAALAAIHHADHSLALLHGPSQASLLRTKLCDLCRGALSAASGALSCRPCDFDACLACAERSLRQCSGASGPGVIDLLLQSRSIATDRSAAATADPNT